MMFNRDGGNYQYFDSPVHSIAKKPGMTCCLLHVSPSPLIAALNTTGSIYALYKDEVTGSSSALPVFHQPLMSNVVANMSWKYDNRSFMAVSREDGHINLLSAPINM